MRKHNLFIISILSIIFLLLSCGKKNTTTHNDAEEAVLNNITTRVSVRSYENKPVEEAKVEKLLRAGMAAPSAMNKQPWHFVVVTDKQQLKALAQANPYAKMAAQAPLAIVVCGDMNKAIEGKGREFWVQDASAATQNILLAAHAMGLGAVWTGTYPSEERCQAVAEILRLPETIIPLNTIVIGYPNGDNQPKDKWSPANVSYNYYGNNDEKTQNIDQQENKTEFTEFDYTSDFKGNPFTWFKGAGLLLAVGDKDNHNAMTIGWGALGNVWGYEVNTITVYVAPARYTFEFMEKYKYFTVMTFDDKHKEVLEYMGTHSGRDGNKEEALGLHVAYTEHGAPYYLEASEVYECEIIYRDQFDQAGFGEIPQKRYANFPAGIHHMYIGKILSAKRK
ncbi:MAG: nitroreductase family protein [Bacteroidales bacterium]|nr:nitroreductase family protein [Bacteroidales bacterium]